MPIYEYSCGKCGAIIERIQKFSDPPLKRHPGCGGTLTKLISQSAFHLKGTGWYVTDYARKGSAEGGEGRKGKQTDSGKDAKTGESDKKKSSTPSAKSGSETGANK